MSSSAYIHHHRCIALTPPMCMPHGWLIDMQLSRISFLHTVMEPKTRSDDVMSSTGQSVGSRATSEGQSKCTSPNKIQEKKKTQSREEERS